jgi:hypothetical protein
MHDNRTTGPGGPGPPLPHASSPPLQAVTLRRISAAGLELLRCRRSLTHRPTVAQLRALARFGGRAPRTYRLDPAREWLPESLPADFPLGAAGLCFAHAGGGAIVALPDGAGFTLH